MNALIAIGLRVLLTVFLGAAIMGYFHLDTKIDKGIGEVRGEIRDMRTELNTKIDTRFDKLDDKLDRLTELLLSGKIKVTAP